jgi:hypothetical protein
MEMIACCLSRKEDGIAGDVEVYLSSHEFSECIYGHEYLTRVLYPKVVLQTHVRRAGGLLNP